MPELPEVEVVKKSLESKIKNLVIKNVKINDGNLRYKLKSKELTKICGLKIKKIERRSKFLLFYLNKLFVILIHLGMTGKFFFIDNKKKKYKTSFYYYLNELRLFENYQHELLNQQIQIQNQSIAESLYSLADSISDIFNVALDSGGAGFEPIMPRGAEATTRFELITDEGDLLVTDEGDFLITP